MVTAQPITHAMQPGSQAIRRVLVVDDSQLQRRVLCAMLSRVGYEVLEANSAEQALQFLNEFSPDLIICDWIMPGMSGLEFCKAFRARKQEEYGYFILLTSKGEKDEVALGFESGADDFLTKPVNAAELRARMLAGERILQMQAQLSEKNRVISETLSQLQAVHDLLDRDLIEAKKLQQSLVREKHKKFATATLSLTLKSSGHVGGDLVGHYPISDSRIGIYSLDVSGHGVSSALMTARLAGYLSSTPEQNVAMIRQKGGAFSALPPAIVVALLNNLLLSELQTEHYFTLALAEVDLQSGRVLMTQAGHPHPLVQRKSGVIEQVGLGGLPVGLIESASYEQFEFCLAAGDRLIVLSDGVTDCVDQQGEFLGDDGLLRMVRRLSGVTGQAFLEAMMQQLREFAGTERFADDISVVLLEYAGPALQQ